MAFIPDEAIAAMGDLTPKAFGLFVYYCKFRNPDQGDIVWPSLETIARDLDIEKPQACELRQQLLKKGWIERVQGDSMRLLKGFTPFGKTEHHSEIPNDIRKFRTTAFGKTEHHSEKPNEPFGNSESHIRKNQPIEPEKKTNTRAQASELSELKTSLARILGWGLAYGGQKDLELTAAAEEILGLVEHYGNAYVPTPARVSRFPDYAKASTFSSFSLRAVVNHWKRAVDWMNAGENQNGIKQRTYQTAHERSTERLRTRDYDAIAAQVAASYEDFEPPD